MTANREWLENQIYKEKARSATVTKERALHEKMLAEYKAELEAQAREQAEAVRRMEAESAATLRAFQEAKQKEAHDQYEKRVKAELAAKEAKDKEIEQLAALELQLIERLKKKKAQQDKAVEQLEAVMQLNTLRTSQEIKKTRDRSAATRSGSPSPTKRSPSKAGAKPKQQAQSSSKASNDQQKLSSADEEIARAFSRYDSNDSGKMKTESLEGEWVVMSRTVLMQVIICRWPCLAFACFLLTCKFALPCVAAGLMRDLKQSLNAAQLEKAKGQLDPKHTGKIDFSEFLLWWKG